MTKLIVGLGNPGSRYAQTRHNIGWLALDQLYTGAWRKEGKGELAEWRVGSEKVLLLKPQTFMNLSGEAVWPLVRFYKLELSDILVVQDDLDMPFGTLKLRLGGRSGGQNGIKSIISALGSEQFARLKLGISRPPAGRDPADWVLSPFLGDEQLVLQQVLKASLQGISLWCQNGVLPAQQVVNALDFRPKPATPTSAQPATSTDSQPPKP